MKKILIVTANYYPKVSKGLIKSAEEVLIKKYKINKIFVPGAFEIPVIISQKIKSYDGFIALGCIIKGKTPHFDFIAHAINYGIMKISIEQKKPIGNGILTCLNMHQVNKRLRKGKEAAEAVNKVLLNE